VSATNETKKNHQPDRMSHKAILGANGEENKRGPTPDHTTTNRIYFQPSLRKIAVETVFLRF
jgi:hypothetical protein